MSEYKSLNSLAIGIMSRKKLAEDLGNYSASAPSTPVSQPSATDDDEGSMAKIQLSALANMASELNSSIQDNQQLEAWVQSKIAIASEMLTGVYNYMKYKK
jgi:hypothetical protein